MALGIIQVTDDRKRLSGMLNFAAEILVARETVRFDMSSGGGVVLREEAMAHLPGIQLNGEEAWMRIARMRETQPPSPPECFKIWLDGSISDPEHPPTLRDDCLVRVEIETASDLVEAELATPEACFPIRLDDPGDDESSGEREVHVLLEIERMDEFNAEFDDWVASIWMPWARQELPRRKSIRIYQALFKLYGMMQGGAGSSAYELVWGIGIARWRKSGQQVLDLPLIEQLADIELEKSGDLVIRPRLVRPQLVMAPYLSLELPQAHQAQVALEPMLAARHEDPDLELSPFDSFSYEDILELAAARLTDAARHVARAEVLEGTSIDEPGPDLVIYGLWALYARPRSEQVRREDLQILARKIEQASAEEDIPEPLRGFVRHMQEVEREAEDEFSFSSEFFGQSGNDNQEGGATSWASAGTNVDPKAEGRRRKPYFFPLPFNEEQSRIIDTLEEKGVAVVTGPPGTGKSHTIANIIAHYMATDHRVLVTAKTAEAISVVQGMLPQALRRLTIAVAHSDREGAKQLEDAISAMSSDASAVNRRELKETIREIESRIVAADADAAMIDSKLGAIVRANLEPILHRGTAVLPMDLAEQLATDHELYGWFVDRPKLEALDALPDHLIEKVRALRFELGGDVVYLGNDDLPSPEDLPGARELIRANVQSADTRDQLAEDFTDAPVMARDNSSAEERGRSLAQALAELDDWLADCAPWEKTLYCSEVCRRLPDGPEDPVGTEPLRAAIKWLREFLWGTDELRPAHCDWPSRLPDEDEFWRAVGDLAQGRQPIGFMARLFKRELKAALEMVRVAGAAPTLPNQWATVQETRRWRNAYDAFLDDWPGAPSLPDLPGVNSDPNNVKAVLFSLSDRVKKLEDRAVQSTKLAFESHALFLYGLTIDQDFAKADHRHVRWALRANLAHGVGRHSALDDLERIANSGVGPIFDLLRDLIVRIDGPILDASEIVEARNALAAELSRLQGAMPNLMRLRSLRGNVADAGAPAWAARLGGLNGTEEEILPETWREAWDWAVAMGKIEAIHALEDPDALRQAKAGLMRDRRRLLEESIQSRTLLSLNGRIRRVHSALANFSQAIRRLGKGTGQEASRWRSEIRRSAMEAAPAIPVWIMPEHKVSEQLPKEIGDFDLVILDEASQSDITALAALARGKRLLVVGDDEQVSPTAIGVTGQKIAELRTRFLSDLNHRNMIDAESSIFDLAQMMFPEGQIMLREHFRSVAAIIAFSSRFYQGGLIPLRIPKPSERLDPPLIDIYLPEGAREEKRNVNANEVSIIVDEIGRIVADPSMAGRSIGVISLIGRHQADEIERALMQSPDIGLEKMQTHRIICGDSTTLQGQERDIVFLSMVTDRANARTMADRKAAQRFNVAMSRARDRLYLVRSVASSHLAPADLKHKVIQHFREPLPDGVKVVDASLIDRCESGFEREVCSRLLEAGYRVIPQMKVGAFSIDLVVEGAEDRRLAIELDGDRFHPPERWEADMNRQAALERAGWVFWRVFGSQWKADPDHWWRRLVVRLEEMSITPIGSAAVNEIYTEHRIVRPGVEPEIVADPETAATPDASAADVTRDPSETTVHSTAQEAALVAEPASELVDARQLHPLLADQPVMSPRAARSAQRPRPTQQGVLPGLGAVDLFTERQPPDETMFHLEETHPEIVGPDMDVAIYFPSQGKRMTIHISSREHVPDGNIIHFGQPLAQALIGASINETTEFDVSGRMVRVVVEGISLGAKAADKTARGRR